MGVLKFSALTAREKALLAEVLEIALAQLSQGGCTEAQRKTLNAWYKELLSV